MVSEPDFGAGGPEQQKLYADSGHGWERSIAFISREFSSRSLRLGHLESRLLVNIQLSQGHQCGRHTTKPLYY